jgi:hypothetical protein
MSAFGRDDGTCREAGITVRYRFMDEDQDACGRDACLRKSWPADRRNRSPPATMLDFLRFLRSPGQSRKSSTVVREGAG